MSDAPFLGEIKLFAGSFPPLNYEFCNGQLLSISEHDTLFALIGTTYGGDGQSNFGLPDLSGRVPIHYVSGPGLSNHILGEKGGAETHALSINQMAAHSHAGGGTLRAQSGEGTSASPVGNVPATSSTGDNQYAASGNTTMSASAIALTIGNAGGNQPHDNMQPYLGISFIIATQGVFPTRP